MHENEKGKWSRYILTILAFHFVWWTKWNLKKTTTTTGFYLLFSVPFIKCYFALFTLLRKLQSFLNHIPPPLFMFLHVPNSSQVSYLTFLSHWPSTSPKAVCRVFHGHITYFPTCELLCMYILVSLEYISFFLGRYLT